LQSDIERCIGLQATQTSGAREGNDCGNHVGLGGHLSHDDSVARAALNLKTIGEDLSRTEVDEVCIVR
jgi:hypothetical protein